jgi:hypothetical protein
VVETAKNRAHVLRETRKKIYYPFVNELSCHIHHVITDASLQFGLQPGVNIFIQQQFQNFAAQLNNFGVQLNRMDARTVNMSIRLRNQRYAFEPLPLHPLRKYVSFSFYYVTHLKNFPRMRVMGTLALSPYAGTRLFPTKPRPIIPLHPSVQFQMIGIQI